MNKFLSLFLTFVTLLCFSACGTVPQNTKTANPPPASANATATPANNILASEKPAATSSPETTSTKRTENYIGNRNSKKFHLPACHSLPTEHNRVYLSSREEAMRKGYEPCQNCNP